MNIKNISKKFLPIILAFTLIIASPSTLALGEVEQPQQMEQAEQQEYNVKEALTFLENLIKFVKLNYAYEVTEEQLVEGAIKGALSVLDGYSSYYTENEFKELNETLSGEFGGIGVHITEKDGYILVVSPIKGTPGFKAGILPEDLIVTVDDVDIKGFTTQKAASLIRGEPGTTVKLGIRRNGEDKLLYFNLTRAIIEINPVEYEILKNNIGYIKITEFNDHALENVIKVLGEFDNNKVKKVIFDLRNNPGGGLNEVLNILRFLIPEGPLVHIRDANENIRTYNSYLDAPKYKLAVLVNGGSASASEIFAGAVQDRGVGTIIGTKTFGKGTVQTVLTLVNGGGLKLTTAEYLTPNKNPVNNVGIEPDIIVENTTEEDLQLKKAIKILKEQ
ncbi:carboxyl-terminal processing protease [Proteiniborus ethanoligenes]|uniref:Carboxyl-terminal processing protease n=1 Tax=Proteiniborus ethanoligenes TaxID=415015 RepID=A0A1H3LZ55_9FIRM|nr:S41 family peptidase [Proteiniborus ethanoligenes]SDY69721.1 carboxyl-terminal processing protease [Proteiniborus ethanoligenes]